VPLQNRVTPFGEIVATPSRGLLFGNRGILHDADRRIVRRWQSKRWIACELEFRGRHREPMPVSPIRYTGLFFLDEATSLAAGHRPCAECRHEDFVRFQRTWSGDGPADHADDIDRVLHAERLEPGRGRPKRTHPARIESLPDGAMIVMEDAPWLVRDRELIRWTPFGYTDRSRRPRAGPATLLTPPSTIEVIRAGYSPDLHPTAD
jgi:hypothetical protein